MAVLTIARDGHLRRNLESALARLIIIHGGGGQVRRVNFNKSKKKKTRNGILTIPDILFLSGTTSLPGILSHIKGF